MLVTRSRRAGAALVALIAGPWACDSPAPPSTTAARAATDGGARPEALRHVPPAMVATASASPGTIIVADWTMGDDLAAMLAAHGQRADARRQRLYLELSASWCTSCRALHQALADASTRAAFAGAYVLRIDVDLLGEQAIALGYDSKDIPAFYEVGRDGRATGRLVDARAWGTGGPEQIAAALRVFFAAS